MARGFSRFGEFVRGEVIDQGPGFEIDVRARGVDDVGGRASGSSGRWPAVGEERRPEQLG